MKVGVQSEFRRSERSITLERSLPRLPLPDGRSRSDAVAPSSLSLARSQSIGLALSRKPRRLPRFLLVQCDRSRVVERQEEELRGSNSVYALDRQATTARQRTMQSLSLQ